MKETQEIFIGIDIGGTNTKYGFVSKTGEVILKNRVSTNSKQTFEQYTIDLWSQIQNDFKKINIDSKYRLKAIGVGAPNANPRNGHIESPQNLEWNTVDLVSIFKSVMGLPVVLENDANIAAIGEKQFGAGKTLTDFVVVTLGTGVGTGSYVNGELFSGTYGIGSEAGHVSIDPNGRICGCGGLGHLEAYASSSGVKFTAKTLLSKDLRFREIKNLFLSGDEEILPVISETAKYLAQGLSMISAVLCPQNFILSGGVSTLGEDFIAMVQTEFDKTVYLPFKSKTVIRLSSISSEDGAILGAASLVLFN